VARRVLTIGGSGGCNGCPNFGLARGASGENIGSDGYLALIARSGHCGMWPGRGPHFFSCRKVLFKVRPSCWNKLRFLRDLGPQVGFLSFVDLRRSKCGPPEWGVRPPEKTSLEAFVPMPLYEACLNHGY
jgi:hypothetical protein